MTERRINAGILGTGHYLPPHILTNEELAQRVDTSDEWITSRTGIHARRIAAADVPATALAEPAARMALADAGIEADAIDLIIFATLTPDRVIPAAACELQRRLGAVHAAAFDLSAACSGFVYAAAVACQFIEAGIYRHVLVIGAEELSKVVDWQDRGTCVLSGDGAGAAVFGPVSAGRGALAFDLGADGSQGEALTIPASGSLHPVTEERLRAGENFIHMDGKAVFRFAVTVMGKTVETSLARAGLTKDALDEKARSAARASHHQYRELRQYVSGVHTRRSLGGGACTPLPQGRSHRTRRLRRWAHMGILHPALGEGGLIFDV